MIWLAQAFSRGEKQRKSLEEGQAGGEAVASVTPVEGGPLPHTPVDMHQAGAGGAAGGSVYNGSVSELQSKAGTSR